MDWARILAFVTGSVDQELLVRAEYLAAENRILKAQLKGRLRLSDARPAAAWFIACIRTQAHDHLVGIHSDASCAIGRNRLLHRGGADISRAGDLLRVVLHPF